MAQLTRFSLWVLFKTGIAMGLMFFAMSFNTLQRVCLDTEGTPALSNMAALVLQVRFIIWRWFFLKSRGESALLEPLSFLGFVFEFFTKEENVLWSLPSSLARSTRDYPSERPTTIRSFSEAIKRPFLGIFILSAIKQWTANIN